MATRWTRECEQARWDWLTTAFGKLQNGTRGVQYIQVVRKMWFIAFFTLLAVLPRGVDGAMVFKFSSGLQIYTFSDPIRYHNRVQVPGTWNPQLSQLSRSQSFGLIIRTRKGDPIPSRIKILWFWIQKKWGKRSRIRKRQGRLAIFYKRLHRKNSQCQKRGCTMLTHVRLRMACDLPVFSISLRKMIQKPNSQRRFGMREGFRSGLP